ncbi:MAG: ROK family protein [Candidatus Moraniibacteriota bacterium]
MKIICFDIGGTKILKAVVEINGGKFKFLEMEKEKNPRNSKKIRNLFLSYCEEMRNKHKTRKVAVSTAGIVNQKRKMILPALHWYGTEKFDFKFLERRGFPVRVENDGRCFALGEYYFGQGRGKQSVLTLTLGTGIGGGFIIKGENYRGAHSSALEVGRSKVYFEKNWHQWEWIVAGRGIEKFYAILSGEKIATKEVFEKAKKSECAAKKVLAQAEEVLGVGISNLLNILDPEVLIFGGSISEQKQFVKRAILIAQKNYINKKANYKFAISSLDNKANLLGAAMLYLK